MSEEQKQTGTETPKVDLEVAERQTGNKLTAANVDALAGIQGLQAPESSPGAMPSFFIQPTDRYRLELDVLFDPKTGRVNSISRRDLNLDFSQFQFFTHTVEWFEFSIPSYEDISIYRQRCAIYRKDAGKVLVDAIQMRNFLLVWHLKDWSLRDASGKKAELKQNSEGALDDDSMKKVNAVSPTLIDVILTNFERDVILT